MSSRTHSARVGFYTEIHDAFPLRSRCASPRYSQTGFTSPFESWDQWLIVTFLRLALHPGLAAIGLLIGGCQTVAQPPSQQTASFVAPVDLRYQAIEERKDEMIRQLAVCESGGVGPSERPIIGGRGAFLGRLQFMVQTVIGYQLKRDGTRLTAKQAAELAHDYDRAASLAKYMIFELEEPWHWPLCSRKIALRQEMANIKEMANQTAQAR